MIWSSFCLNSRNSTCLSTGTRVISSRWIFVADSGLFSSIRATVGTMVDFLMVRPLRKRRKDSRRDFFNERPRIIVDSPIDDGVFDACPKLFGSSVHLAVRILFC